MTEYSKIQHVIASVQKWSRLNQTSYNVDDKKSEAVQNFSDKILAKLKESIISKDVDFQKEMIEELSSYSDLFKIQYIRTSFWEKLTRSKKNPQIQYVKDTLSIFDELSVRNPHFASSFCMQIQTEAEIFEKQVRERRAEIRKLTPVEGQEFDEDGDYLPDKLALVHVTDYKPKRNEDGLYVVETTAQATDFKIPRNTIHFAINHHVGSHLHGAWDDKPYVIVAPMNATMDKNGKPVYIDSRDTFFEFGVNDRMVLPEETHLFEPASKDLPNGILSVTKGNRTIYKASGFTDEDVKKLLLGIKKDKIEKFNRIQEPSKREKFLASLSKKQALSSFLMEKGYARITNHGPDQYDNIPQMANMAKKMGVEGGRADAHANFWITGQCHPLYNIVDDILLYLSGREKILSAKQIVKGGRSGLIVDGEEMWLHSIGIPENMLNVKDYFDNYIKKCRDSTKMSLSNSPGDEFLLETIKKHDAILQQQLPFEQRFFDEVKVFTPNQRLRLSPKEQEVFMAWVDKTQQRVDNIVKAMDGRTLDEIIQSKSTSTSPQAIGATLRKGGR